MQSSTDPGESRDPGGQRSIEHLYTRTLNGEEDRFHRRNGVFYPTGFALFALPDEGKLAKAVELLIQGGVPENEITLLRPEQMHQLAEDSKRDAGLLAQIVAAELKQMTVLEQLADVGNHFLLVRHTDQIDELLHTLGAQVGASKGLLFHRLVIEELPVGKETIPGPSPFGVDEVIRTQPSDAELSGDRRR
jgi:hypothetical protein